MEGKDDGCEREEKICTCEEGLYIFWRGKKEGDMEKKNVYSSRLQFPSPVWCDGELGE